jgi:hypothetical protein
MSNNTKLIKKIIIAAAVLACFIALAVLSRERAAGGAAGNTTESITGESNAVESSAAESTAAESSVTDENQAENDEQALTAYWSVDSAAAQSLRDYVTKVTDEANADSFIPVKDRIAVFDMDGTLTCETFYTYYDTMMFIEYCLYDHPDQVSEELKQAAEEIKPGYKADETLARNFAKAYAGMTVDEFYEYAVEFGKKYTDSFNNMRYID